jgi:hypothetical protein
MTKHIPGRPASPEPPDGLSKLAESFRHPAVTRVGLTTTAKGEWALLVGVPRGAAVPIDDVERAADGYTVVYDHDADELPVARPAYPERGE